MDPQSSKSSLPRRSVICTPTNHLAICIELAGSYSAVTARPGVSCDHVGLGWFSEPNSPQLRSLCPPGTPFYGTWQRGSCGRLVDRMVAIPAPEQIYCSYIPPLLREGSVEFNVQLLDHRRHSRGCGSRTAVHARLKKWAE